MTTTNPTEELRAAATLLHDKATAAIHEGRTTWSTGHTLGSRSPVVVDDQEQPSVLIETYAARLERVNSYLALVGPATGLAVAAWLNTAARMATAYPEMAHDHDRPACDDFACDVMGAALAVARQILGGTQ